MSTQTAPETQGAGPVEPAPATPAAQKAKTRRLMRQTELVDRVKAYDPDADEDLLNKAYVYAMKAHGKQFRASGDPYFAHPLEVAAILTDLKLDVRSEEHTSELQSHVNLVCRLLLEKKKWKSCTIKQVCKCVAMRHTSFPR